MHHYSFIGSWPFLHLTFWSLTFSLYLSKKPSKNITININLNLGVFQWIHPHPSLKPIYQIKFIWISISLSLSIIHIPVCTYLYLSINPSICIIYNPVWTYCFLSINPSISLGLSKFRSRSSICLHHIQFSMDVLLSFYPSISVYQ